MSEIKTEEKRAIRGGEFLVKETNPNEIFIPEEWNEEQRMIEQMCYDFMKAELFPREATLSTVFSRGAL